MPCSVLVAFKGVARRAWGRPLAARGWWAQTSQKVNFAYCTDHRPVQPSHIESAVKQLCFMKPSTLICVCLFSSPRSCKQGPGSEPSSSVAERAACQWVGGTGDGRATSSSQSSLKPTIFHTRPLTVGMWLCLFLSPNKCICTNCTAKTECVCKCCIFLALFGVTVQLFH